MRVGAYERFVFQGVGFELGQRDLLETVRISVCSYVEVQMGVRMIADQMPSAIPCGDQMLSGFAVHPLSHDKEYCFELVAGESRQDALVDFMPSKIGAALGGWVIKREGDFRNLVPSPGQWNTGQGRSDSAVAQELSAIHRFDHAAGRLDIGQS